MAGVRSGDRILAADGEPLRDLIDWRWHASGPVVTVEFERAGVVREATLRRDRGSWGVEFADVVFDGIRTCRNACEFCFVSQLPPGLRPSLYVRDDDFRLSFLSGNFITLTNLTDDDVDRIVEQRLSPLYVSLHAVRPDVRSRLIACRGEDLAVQRASSLLAAGIRLHVQIVLVPGTNDGDVLDETLSWLVGRGGVESVGIVPLGFTAHQESYAESFGVERSRAVLQQVCSMQPTRSERGRWIQLADEFYLAAGEPIPDDDAYGDYPQLENGIGLTRLFSDGWDACEVDRSASSAGAAIVLCTGELFAPVLACLLDRRALECVSVLPVPNVFFGGGVNVTGLLTGQDLARTISEDVSNRGDARYLVPDCILNEDGLTLDGLAADDLSADSAADVQIVPAGPVALARALSAR
jgi:putative radical SAM enzyme (TIGR03279 family)